MGTYDGGDPMLLKLRAFFLLSVYNLHDLRTMIESITVDGLIIN